MTELVRPIRVLIVDDSMFMRKSLSMILKASDLFEVVGTARSGEDALQRVDELRPDVMTLDIDMPGMDGLAVLEHLMARHPIPVVVVSALTEVGAAVTIRALELGAVDFLPKHLDGSAFGIAGIREQLLEKVRVAALTSGKICSRSSFSDRSNVKPTNRTEKAAGRRPMADTLTSGPLVVIGCSTGGPQALQELLPQFDASFPAGMVIAQHMPKFFTRSFADRLNQLCHLEVREAREHDSVHPGLVLIAPGGQHLTLYTRRDESIGVQCIEAPDLPYRPSVDLLMQSAAKACGSHVIGVVLTGMGNDGLGGMHAIKAAHGTTIVQDEASCMVYGMPKAVIEGGWADRVAPLSKIADEIGVCVEKIQDKVLSLKS